MPMHAGGMQWVSVNAGCGGWGLDSSCVMTEKLPAPGGQEDGGQLSFPMQPVTWLMVCDALSTEAGFSIPEHRQLTSAGYSPPLRWPALHWF